MMIIKMSHMIEIILDVVIDLVGIFSLRVQYDLLPVLLVSGFWGVQSLNFPPTDTLYKEKGGVQVISILLIMAQSYRFSKFPGIFTTRFRFNKGVDYRKINRFR